MDQTLMSPQESLNSSVHVEQKTSEEAMALLQALQSNFDIVCQQLSDAEGQYERALKCI